MAHDFELCSNDLRTEPAHPTVCGSSAVMSTVLGFARYVVDGCRAISGRSGQTMAVSSFIDKRVGFG